MSEFIEVISPSALKDLQTLNAEITKTVAGVKEVNANMINVKTPSGADSAIKKLQTEVQKLHDTQVKAQQQLEKNRLQEIKLEQAREKAFDKYQKQSTRELEQVKKVSGLYNQAQIKVRELSEMYNDLAIKKQFGQQLTAKEQTQLAKLTAELNIYQSALKKVDSDIQKNQRNVGNYASGWNGLGNSINQLSREMPAFANSVQTGFMAISNNLPIFFDEIEKIKTQNKELIAQGQPVKSVFSQIAGAVLSWGTALSVGVTLLTVFGPKIWDMVSGSKATKKALEEEKKVREEKANIEKQAYEQQVRYASDEQAKSKILLETAKNLTLSMSERNKAVKELQERYPDYLGKLSREKILAGETAEAETLLNDALMKRAMFLAVQDKIIETTKQLVDAEMKYAETNAKSAKTEELYDYNIQKKTASKQKYRLVNEQDLQTTKGLESVVKNADKTNVNSTSIYNEKTLAVRKQLDILYKILNGYAKYANVVNDLNKKDKKDVDIKREQIEAVKMQANEVQGLINKLNALKSALEKQRAEESRSREDYEKFTQTINAVQRSIDGLTTGYNELTASGKKGSEEFINLYKNMKYVDNTTKELTDNMKNYLEGFQSGFFSEAGMPTLFKALNKEIEGFGENFAVTFTTMAEIAQEAFAVITQASNANFANEYANLERQRDIALAFAGDSASAREEIERQAEQKRRAIQKREFQAQKQQALVNIAINTAQAIIATLARTPLPAGLPLVIATGALGAIQAGVVASQQMPAFWKGTDNAPEGWAWTQEKGREVILDKRGNIKSLGSDKGATATYLNKGDKVLTAEKTMDFLMFNNDLNNILTGNGINLPKVEVNNQGMTDGQVNAIVQAIKTKETANISIDKRGIREYVTNGRQITERMNNRVQFKGTSV
jgi:hypothetical protein